MEIIQDSIAQVAATFHQRMDHFESELKNSTGSTTTSSIAAEFATFKTFVMASLRSLQTQTEFIANGMDHMEMRSRRKILLIHGVAEVNKENIASVITTTLSDKLKLTSFSISDVKRCHRLGRTTGDRPRPILLKLKDTTLRNKIWASKSDLKGTGVTLSEFLTKARYDIFMAARLKFGIAKCWTRDGTVYVLGSGGTRHRISSLKQLDDIKLPEASKPPAAVKDSVPVSKSRRGAVASKK